MATDLRAFRASILHFRGDPGSSSGAESCEYFEDGLLLVEDGRVARVGPADELLQSLPRDTKVLDRRPGLIVPGFIDAHVHYSQTDVIASAGRNLLHWLEEYTFPEEARFAEHAHAAEVAEFFLDELIRHGTTTAMVFGTVHRASADAIFAAAERRNLRLAAGPVMMDRHCPDCLQDTPESVRRDTRELVERWDGQGRLHYAITPRFAITSSDAQLQLAGELARAHPNAFVHSHLAENIEEVAWVRVLFPDCRSYLDVYDHFGLLRERAIYAHCLHLDTQDRKRMGESGAAAAFCPTSNLFLGSGLFDLAASDAAGMPFALATDVGGGTSFSMLQTMQDAYKVAQLQGQHLSATRAFYLATRGGARAMRLEDRIGSFAPGNDADFIVLDSAATPLLARRERAAKTLEERLFAWMILGDDRGVREVYVMGRPAITGAVAG
ncbi:MAG: guanine deaminase [Usitatibacter sp.]